MEFKKYNSISNCKVKKIIELEKMHIDVWVALEKIRGSNFSFWVNDKDVKTASREGFTDNSFYNCMDVIDEHYNKVKKIFGLIKRHTNRGLSHITIYGELFGGSYFDGLYPNTTKVKSIQPGIFYTPGRDFMVFDIMLHYADCIKVLSFSEVTDLCDEVEIKTVPIVGTGSLNEMLKIDNTFRSLVPQNLDLKEDLDVDNIAEGLVIRPFNVDEYAHNRGIIKSKNDKWSENIKPKKDKPKTPSSSVLLNKMEEIEPYINKNRLESVLSKVKSIENISMNDYNKILGMFSKDVIKDVQNDDILHDGWRKDNELKFCTRLINEKAREVIDSYLVPLMKNN